MDNNNKPAPEYRKCRSCSRILPIDNFYVNESCRGGHEPRCKECKATRKAYTKSSADISLSEISYEILVEELRRRGFKGQICKSKIVTI